MKTLIKRCMRGVSLIALILLVQIPVVAQDACERGSRTFQLVITVTGNAPSGVTRGGINANDQNVCRGDTVTWRVPSMGFTLSFNDGSPFASADLTSDNSNSVSATVSGDAERGRGYKYDITLENGEVLDPRIIVD
jgi:hypothetical protein